MKLSFSLIITAFLLSFSWNFSFVLSRNSKKASKSSQKMKSASESRKEDYGMFAERVRSRIKTSPESGELHMALGMTLQQQDLQNHNGGINQPEALRAYENAIRLGVPDSEQASLFLNTGILLTTMSRPLEAVDTYNTILATAVPTELERVALLFNRGQAFNTLGRLRDAEKDFLTVLELDANYCRAISGLVSIVKDDPGSTVSWPFLVSIMLNTLSTLELELQSAGADLHRSVALSIRSSNPVAPLRKLFVQLSGKRELKELSTSFLQIATIHFSLSTAIEAALRFKTTYTNLDVSIANAWQHVLLGNSFDSARRNPYDQAAEEGQVMTYSSVFKEGFWPMGVGSTTRDPIFVVGLMRSGSTLVESVLAAHSQAFGMGEDSVFNGQLPVIRDGVVSAIGTGSAQALTSAVDKFAADVVKGMKGKVPKAKRGVVKKVVDKMLFNFRNIGFIHMLFPNAVIIHTVRGFEDCIMSNYKHKFEDTGLEWSFSIHDLVHFFACYRRMMRHWETVLPGRVLTVQYEHMVSAPKQSMMRIMAHCGISWEENVMDFQNTERAVHTFSQQQVKQGIYSTSVQGSRKYRKHLSPLLESSPLWSELEDEVEDLNWVTGDIVTDPWTPEPEDKLTHTVLPVAVSNKIDEHCGVEETIATLEKQKLKAVAEEEYLKAAALKDQIALLKQQSCQAPTESMDDFSDLISLLPPLVLKPLDLSSSYI